MANRHDDYLVGMLIFVNLYFSILILLGGILISQQSVTESEWFLDWPVIAIGVFLVLVSLAGLTGTFCQVTWLLRIYQVVTVPLIVLSISFTVFTFAVTYKGPGGREAVSGRGYRLGDYSNWLQNRVTNEKNWNMIKSSLAESKVCTVKHNLNTSSDNEFYKNHLYSSVQSGYCKPPTECRFDYAGPTNWTRGGDAVSTNNPDCNMWDNNLDTLCFNCQSCKAGFVDFLRSQGKKVSTLNIGLLVFIIVFYINEYCNFRKRRDECYYLQQAGKPQGP